LDSPKRQVLQLSAVVIFLCKDFQKKSPADVIEGVQEFLRSDAGRAEFADDHASGGVGEHGRISERSAGSGGGASTENRVTAPVT
jgi:hypothetical protein